MGIYPALITEDGSKLNTPRKASNNEDFKKPEACRPITARTASSSDSETRVNTKLADPHKFAAVHSYKNGSQIRKYCDTCQYDSPWFVSPLNTDVVVCVSCSREEPASVPLSLCPSSHERSWFLSLSGITGKARLQRGEEEAKKMPEGEFLRHS